MKLLVLIIFTTFFYLGNVVATSSEFKVEENEIRGIIDDFINSTLIKILNASDPIQIANFSNHFNNPLLTGLFSISNLKISGIKSTVASYIKVHYSHVPPSSINITLDVKDVNLFSNYDIDLVLGEILPFYGKGNLSLNLENINIAFFTDADVVLIPTSISGFKNISVVLTVGERTNFSIQGLFNNNDFNQMINDIIGEMTPRIIGYLNTNKDNIGKIISKILQSIVDGIFKNL